MRGSDTCELVLRIAKCPEENVLSELAAASTC
jgi:hypothetical protein